MSTTTCIVLAGLVFFISTYSGLALFRFNCHICSCFSQIEDALAMKDKKYNISVIVSSCNVFSVTLLCSFLW